MTPDTNLFRCMPLILEKSKQMKMKKYIKRRCVVFYLPLIMMLVFSSCDKSDIQPLAKEFPIIYNFVNDTEDLKVVNFTTYTYYPKEDRTIFYYEHFKSVLRQEKVVMKADTTLANGILGYKGCLSVSQFEIWASLPGNKVYVSEWTTPIDTIQNINNSNIYYRWPSDTLKWQKKRGIIIEL